MVVVVVVVIACFACFAFCLCLRVKHFVTCILFKINWSSSSKSGRSQARVRAAARARARARARSRARARHMACMWRTYKPLHSFQLCANAKIPIQAQLICTQTHTKTGKERRREGERERGGRYCHIPCSYSDSCACF